MNGSAADRPNSQTNEQIVRLSAAALVLLERHQMNGNGRCQACRTRSRWRLGRKEPCIVQVVLSFCLDESLELVWRQVRLYGMTRL